MSFNIRWGSFQCQIFFGLTLILLLETIEGTECWKRKYALSYLGFPINNTLKCPMSFQWTVSDFCCYDKYDQYEDSPYCCYSETYKLALAVGFICLVLLGSSFSFFCCWFYNLPHHLLYIFTCRKFHLNDWLAKTRNGPYVDPSFYSGEPFWSPGAEIQPYPLRPMPPRIFYPAPPPNLKFRWDMGQGDMPLFVLASRQFHRNPYSARPHDRTHPHHNPNALTQNQNPSFFSMMSESRRSSITTLPDKDSLTMATNGSRGISSSNSSHHHRSSTIGGAPPMPMPMPFKITIDEVEAATELMEALRMMEEKSDSKDFNGTWDVSDILGEPTNNPNHNNSFMSNSTINDNPNYNYNTNTGSIIALQQSAASSSCSGGYQQCQPPSTPQSSNNNNLHHQQIQQQISMSRGGKMTVEIMNHQLSSSLSMNINNLPNVHVVGNFGNSNNNNNTMETILEDDGAIDEEIYLADSIRYNRTPPLTPPQKHRVQTPRGNVQKTDEVPRISSALDRIVTRARAEVPFRPSLPGHIPENPYDEDPELTTSIPNLNRSDRALNPVRRNSAPVNF